MALQSGTSHPALSYADPIAAHWSNFLLLAGRTLLGWLFVASGLAALGNMAGTAAYFAALGLSPVGFFAWFAVIVELVLGTALILGFATRYAAIATFFWVLAATLIGHRYWEYPAAQQFTQYNYFLKNLSIMGGLLYTLVMGAGRYSVDTVLAKR